MKKSPDFIKVKEILDLDHDNLEKVKHVTWKNYLLELCDYLKESILLEREFHNCHLIHDIDIKRLNTLKSAIPTGEKL